MVEIAIKSRVVGIDIGVKKTVLAIVDVRGDIIARGELSTSDYPDISDYVTALSDKIVMLAEANGGYETVRSVGISAPSANFVTGCIENAPNLQWKGVVPLAALLRDRLGLAVAVANDAHVTALGEHVYGSAHGMQNFIVISLGHGGVGSCLFSNGQLHLGARGFSGEFGHTCVAHDGRQCSCGRIGCVEEYASARGMAKTARELLAATDEPSLMRDGDLSPMSLVSYCEQGDALAIKVCQMAGHTLGMAVANYASLIDPEAIIFTGELVHMGHWLLDPTYEAFDDHVFHNIVGKVKLLASILDDNERDVLGASALAWDVKEYSLFK
ncbi:MAG: ROK family protein [Prevotella sp.]|nr:ROK family protein [Prevotella sp.]